MDIITAKQKVIEAGKLLVEEGLIQRTWGNVSCRVSDTQFVITPSGMDYLSLSPEKIQWESDDTIMSLERPLVIKYTDKAVLEELRSKGRVEKTNEEKNRQDFLDSL